MDPNGKTLKLPQPLSFEVNLRLLIHADSFLKLNRVESCSYFVFKFVSNMLQSDWDMD